MTTFNHLSSEVVRSSWSGGSCQSQRDSLRILLRALLRLSWLGPRVWRALWGLRFHKKYPGVKQGYREKYNSVKTFFKERFEHRRGSLKYDVGSIQAYELHLAGWQFQVTFLNLHLHTKPSSNTPLQPIPQNQISKCLYKVFFYTGPPLKILKYGKPRLGESTLT